MRIKTYFSGTVEAAIALARFRKEVREAGFSEDELSDILDHISALEQEVKAPTPE